MRNNPLLTKIQYKLSPIALLNNVAATVESNMGKDINPLDDTKKDEVNFRYQRFRGKVTKDMEATGNYVKRGNQWFVKKEK